MSSKSFAVIDRPDMIQIFWGETRFFSASSMGGGRRTKERSWEEALWKIEKFKAVEQARKSFPTLLAIWHTYVVEEDIEIPINNVPPLAVAGEGFFKKKMDGKYTVVPT